MSLSNKFGLASLVLSGALAISGCEDSKKEKLINGGDVGFNDIPHQNIKTNNSEIIRLYTESMQGYTWGDIRHELTSEPVGRDNVYFTIIGEKDIERIPQIFVEMDDQASGIYERSLTHLKFKHKINYLDVYQK